MLREKQMAFCNEYIRCKNPELAAKNAGYNPRYGKVLLSRSEITDFCSRREISPTIPNTEEENSREKISPIPTSLFKIEEGTELGKESPVLPSEQSPKNNNGIATAEDVLRFLTNIMTGEEAMRDKLRAAELLGKRYGLFKETADEEENKCLVIVGEDKL